MRVTVLIIMRASMGAVAVNVSVLIIICASVGALVVDASERVYRHCASMGAVVVDARQRVHSPSCQNECSGSELFDCFFLWLLAYLLPFFFVCLLLLWLWFVIVGCWLFVIGCWLLVVDCWLLVVGCGLLFMLQLILLLWGGGGEILASTRVSRRPWGV